MKRILVPLISCISLILISGCWSRIEVNDLAIITATAIDLTEENEIEITVQVYVPKSMSVSGQGGGGGGSSESTFVRSATGNSFADAVSKLQLNVPRKLFWGQCKIYILGMEISKKGVQEQLDFIVRNPRTRGNSYLYVTKDKSEEVLSLIPPLEGSTGAVLRKMTDVQEGFSVNLKDFVIKLTGQTEVAALPILEILPPNEGKKKTDTIPVITGTAIFKNDKMISTLNVHHTRGLIWLRDEISEYTVSFTPENEEGEIILNPLEAKVKQSPVYKDGQWIMNIMVETEGDVIQNTTPLALNDPQVLKRLEKDLEKDIQSRIKGSIKTMQEDLNADIFFGENFYRKYPDEWKKVKDNWNEEFPNVQVNVNVTAKITGPGMTVSPSGIPEDEVKRP